MTVYAFFLRTIRAVYVFVFSLTFAVCLVKNAQDQHFCIGSGTPPPVRSALGMPLPSKSAIQARILEWPPDHHGGRESARAQIDAIDGDFHRPSSTASALEGCLLLSLPPETELRN